MKVQSSTDSVVIKPASVHAGHANGFTLQLPTLLHVDGSTRASAIRIVNFRIAVREASTQARCCLIRLKNKWSRGQQDELTLSGEGERP